MKTTKRSLILMLIAASFIFTNPFYAQDDRINQRSPDFQQSIKTPSIEDYLFNQLSQDYKVIASNSSYIEIEYYPAGLTPKEIYFNSEKLTILEFNSGISKGLKYTGSPDIRSRGFGVMFPSDRNNTVQVVDFDVKEMQNITIAPIPQIFFADPNVRNFESIYYTYNKNSEYSENKYFPEQIALLAPQTLLRDIPFGNLIVNPYQYNPVTRNVKVYTRIRVRINFGEAPVLLNKPRNKQEIELLSGSAINSGNAINWVSPEYKAIYSNRIVTSSVLSAGDWYKIEVKDNGENGSSEGMYKITKSFLEGAGINLSGIDARTIKIYGNGGELLPDHYIPERPADLTELAVYFEGEADGSFDANDFIVFYGKSVNNWKHDSLSNTFRHYLNYHSRSNYYWICLNTTGNGRRMETVQSENTSGAITPSSFYEKIFFEPEQNNLINEGNLWLSVRKNPGQSHEWNTTLSGLENGSDIFYRVKLASRCMYPNTNYFLVKDDYSNMAEYQLQMGQVFPGFGDWIAVNTAEFFVNQSQKTNGEQIKVRSTYYATNGEAEGYLDWCEIVYKRRFNSVSGDAISFNSPDTNGTVEYNISSFSNNNIKVFDASAHSNVKIIQPLNATSNNVRFQRNESGTAFSKYCVVGQNSGYKTPTGISSRINNQNLRGIADGASFIIITHKDFIGVAERLKNKREQGGASNPNYLKTIIVTTEQIYNEFSGGLIDAVAIRDFIRYAFINWTERPSYVCLLGDGNFDYKNILGYGSNFVPPWEFTSPTINQVSGFTSDDFYVDVTGKNIFPSNAPPDIAIGRIPARSYNEANEYIDKLDDYENGVNNGYWKNRMLFVADDERTSEGCENVGHLYQCETLAEIYTPSHFDKIKVYLVNYPTIITPQGRRKPQVNADIVRYWTEGVINIHWTGHGSPDVWAHEYILEKDNIISQINNINKLPFVSIASCDMSKFDNPANQSAGEFFMISERKGAIGTLAATRPVYASGNAAMFYEIFKFLYQPRDTLLLQKRFGAGILNAKNNLPSYTDNEAKYVLMCDPTLRTQIPRFRSHIDSISGLSGDTMKALSRVKIYGSVIRPDSSLWNDYNGKIILKVYDVDRQVSLIDECNIPHTFRQNGGIIYSGTQNIVNGKWIAEYVVPRDISYLNQQGRLINYFYNTEYDGAGINRNFIVGGINPNAAVDTTGPLVSLFANNRNFRTGDRVGENFKFIADLFDESGINTTGTIGHKLEAVLDGNENNKYDLTNFYISDTSYKSGTIEYDFSGMSLGKHTLKLKAWDTYNNSSESTIELNVTSSGVITVTDIYNYPNPFKDNTVFTFQHNYPTNIDVKIKVYTVAGRLIKELDAGNISDKFVSINWDGKDADGETLGNGIYIYKLIVESSEGTSITNVGKLAVLK